MRALWYVNHTSAVSNPGVLLPVCAEVVLLAGISGELILLLDSRLRGPWAVTRTFISTETSSSSKREDGEEVRSEGGKREQVGNTAGNVDSSDQLRSSFKKASLLFPLI